MQKLKVFLFSFLFGWGALLLGADTNWRTYSLKRYPKNPGGCEQTAKDVGEKFTKVTGQSVFRATCEKESKEGYDILITYVTPTPVPFVTTLNESGGLGYQGIFRTLEECLKALPQETDTFSNATGLTPFVSYCFKESDINLTPYLARVDAWGDAKLYPYRFEQTVFATSVDKASEVLESIRTSAKDAGISVHQVSFAHDGILKIVIRYYGLAKEQIFHSGYFKSNEVASYPSLGTPNAMETCRSVLNESARRFLSTFSTPGIYFCAWDKMLFEAKLYLLRIRRTEGIKSDTTPVRYSTFSDCDRERPSVQEWYEKNLGVTPFNIICTWKSGFGTGKPDAFVMRVLTKVKLEEELPSWSDLDFDGGFK